MRVKTFQDIIVWQKAHQLVLSVYRIIKHFPIDERFGLISQIRRASVSVPANITEGYFRRSRNDRIHFYNIAQSSLEELKYHLLLSRDLGYIPNDAYEKVLRQAEEVGRMLYSWIKHQH